MCTSDNRHCHKAALEKSECRFISLINKQKVTENKETLGETIWERNLETNQTQKGTYSLLGNTE